MKVEARESQRKVPLQKVCTRISSGGTPSRKRSEYFENGSHLWVKSQELRDGSIYATEERITDEALATSSAKLHPENTVLIAMYGATVGKLGLLRQQASVNQAICALVVDEQIADYKFVFYSLAHNREDLVSKAFGAAQQNLNQGLIRNFKICLPPLSTQRRIASVLSAYDVLIENNTRRIKILEEMAQRIYREWFVDFRFPGHEKVGIVEVGVGADTGGVGGKEYRGGGGNYGRRDSFHEEFGVLGKRRCSLVFAYRSHCRMHYVHI
jgi:type I restriction enzyme S subunit